MMYCIEIDRRGIGEGNMVHHCNFDGEPDRKEILEYVIELDCGYDDNYCKINYYKIC